MVQTVIGIFDRVADADNAVERLTNSGFDRGLIDLSINKTEPSADRKLTEDLPPDDDAFGERVNVFFRSLFPDESEIEKFSSVARTGEAIITVQTKTENEAMHVARILDECGAVDVEDRAKSYGKGSAPGGGSDSEANPADRAPSEVRPVSNAEQREKRDINSEGATFRSRIVHGPVEENARLREERVKVNPDPSRKTEFRGLYDFSNTFRKPRASGNVPHSESNGRKH
jgi:hypothetical protein